MTDVNSWLIHLYVTDERFFFVSSKSLVGKQLVLLRLMWERVPRTRSGLSAWVALEKPFHLCWVELVTHHRRQPQTGQNSLLGC